MKIKDFHFFIYDKVQVPKSPHIYIFLSALKHRFIFAVIDEITHRASRIQWGIVKFFISIEEEVLDVIKQSIFSHGIYKILFIFDNSNEHFLICELQ